MTQNIRSTSSTLNSWRFYQSQIYLVKPVHSFVIWQRNCQYGRIVQQRNQRWQSCPLRSPFQKEERRWLASIYVLCEGMRHGAVKKNMYMLYSQMSVLIGQLTYTWGNLSWNVFKRAISTSSQFAINQFRQRSTSFSSLSSGATGPSRSQ